MSAPSAPPAYDTTIPNSYTAPPNIQPPDYETVQDPPPSYNSIFGEIQEVRQKSSGIVDFFKNLIVVLGSTIGCTVCLGFIFAIPVSCIVVGAKYKNECPAERMIPIYLIVAGSFGVLWNVMELFKKLQKHISSDDDEEGSSSSSSNIIIYFLIVWFIAGNVWIYRTYEPNYDDKTSYGYCNPILYQFAFWLTNCFYILLGVLICCACCVGVCSSEDEPEVS